MLIREEQGTLRSVSLKDGKNVSDFLNDRIFVRACKKLV